MKIKKLLSLITAAAISTSCFVGMAITAGATIDTQKTISSEYTFIADTYTSNGTVAATGDLGDYVYSTSNNFATNKGSSVINGEEHLNSMKVKGVNVQFKVSIDCTVVLYGESHSSREWCISDNGGTTYTRAGASTGTLSATVDVDESTNEVKTVSIASFSTGTTTGGDMYLAGFEVIPTSIEEKISNEVKIANGIENGTVTTTPADSAKEGDIVTVNAEPAEGYKLKAITVTIDGGGDVTVTGNTFVMPAAPVTVSADFEEKTTFAINCDPNSNVTTLTTKVNEEEVTEAEEGDTVLITAAYTKAGYHGTEIKVTGESGDAVTVNVPTSGNVSFVMPSEPVTVSVETEPTTAIPDDAEKVEAVTATGQVAEDAEFASTASMTVLGAAEGTTVNSATDIRPGTGSVNRAVCKIKPNKNGTAYIKLYSLGNPAAIKKLELRDSTDTPVATLTSTYGITDFSPVLEAKGLIAGESYTAIGIGTGLIISGLAFVPDAPTAPDFKVDLGEATVVNGTENLAETVASAYIATITNEGAEGTVKQINVTVGETTNSGAITGVTLENGGVAYIGLILENVNADTQAVSATIE